MKNFKYIVLYTIALSVMMSSCKKSFLDQQPKSGQISADEEAAEAKKDPSLLKARISGLYTTMITVNSGGSGGDDDFGQKGYDIYSDMLSTDMALGALNYGWYGGLARFTWTKDNTSSADYAPFRYYYKIIFGANTVIDVMGGNDAVLTTADFKHYMGQAKAIRAYAYFYLANLYAQKGYGTGSEKMLPIYTSSKDLNKPLSTSAQVYAQMEKDLNDAITLLGDYTRDNKNQIDLQVAKGLLAYVYAARGTNDDLAKVITLTDDVLAKYPLTTNSQVVAQLVGGKVTNPESGFNNVATPSWIWGADLTLANNLDLVSWWGQMDIFTYSYAWAGDPKFIDDELYGAIHNDDVRKKQFDDNPDYGGLIPTGKFFDPARVEGGQRNVITDYVYMRADEMLLLNAEAKSRLSKDDDAKKELKKLLDLRITDDSYVNALSGSALREEIYLQSRIELWGEGKTYLAMKRNKHSVTLGTNHLFFNEQTYTYDAPDLTFPLPSAEILYNPNLTK